VDHRLFDWNTIFEHTQYYIRRRITSGNLFHEIRISVKALIYTRIYCVRSISDTHSVCKWIIHLYAYIICTYIQPQSCIQNSIGPGRVGAKIIPVGCVHIIQHNIILYWSRIVLIAYCRETTNGGTLCNTPRICTHRCIEYLNTV